MSSALRVFLALNFLGPETAFAQYVPFAFLQSPANYTVGSITMTNGGSGYTSAPTMSFSGGGGAGAAATAVLGNPVDGSYYDSTIASIVIASKGSGYTSQPTISVSGGSGLAATANIGNITASVSGLSGSGGYGIYSHTGSYTVTISVAMKHAARKTAPATFAFWSRSGVSTRFVHQARAANSAAPAAA